jgi:hypothetical protein
VTGVLAVAVVFFSECACSSGLPTGAPDSAAPSGSAAAPPSSPLKEISSSVLSAYEAARVRAWDPTRRFKALFRAEASPKVGAIGRGYLSVWWDGASGGLEWRLSAPIAGSGRGGILRTERRKEDAAVGDAEALPLPGKLAAADLIACILGTPAAPAPPSSPFEETPRGWSLRIEGTKRTALLDRDGHVIEMHFPNGEVVSFQPGEGVPRRVEAKGPDGRAVLVLESYGPWSVGEEVPPL